MFNRAQIVSIRSVTSAMLTAATVARLKQQDESLTFYGSRDNRLKLLSRGLCGGAAMTLYYASIQLLPLPDAVVVFFTNVLFTAVAFVIMGYERLTWLMAAGCTACTGVCMLCCASPLCRRRVR
jgi:drug/metabolite transporter (DMT)-like permease